MVVVPSITINPSASASVIDEVDFAEPSSKLSSAAVEPIAVPPISNAVAASNVCTLSLPVPSDARMAAVPPDTSEEDVIA